jgi:hypothetical protein
VFSTELKMLKSFFRNKKWLCFFGGQKFVYVFKNHFQVKMAKFFLRNFRDQRARGSPSGEFRNSDYFWAFGPF